MNVCLVLPDYGKNMINDPCCYPLGFMYVSSFLKALGHKVKVLNFNLFDYDLEKEFEDQKAICLTGYEQFLEQNKKIHELAQKMGIRTLLGGALATFKYTEMKKIFNGVFRGECEGNAPINMIPWPDYDGFGIKEYNKRHLLKYIGLLTSRGCPFSCTFCAHTCKFRERDLQDVADELDHYIKKYGSEYVVFNDNTLNVTKKRFMEICKMVKSRHILWSAAIRCDVFDEDMAIAAKESGCQYFVVGVESFKQSRLDKMNKKLKVEEIKCTLDLLNKYNISYHGNIILGLDNESLEDITQEIEELPKQYSLFPVLAQSFSGTKVSSILPIEQRTMLNGIFAKYTEKQNKYSYEGVN
jgi:radical SAM superfamily enzyme YgiQ (UPF0313 family)